MAVRQVAREPEVFEIDWGDRFAVLPWTEDKTEDIKSTRRLGMQRGGEG